ncbi:MAG TPA: hypothetical protein VK645_12005, partial [Chitinophagaceae bacterium]|nr:hypothetical protein [Chitinophagaceae bacterium]
MKITFSLAGLVLTTLLLFSSCKKNKDAVPSQEVDTGTGVGTPTGQSVTKTIDATGGQLSSADGKVQVTIPAGALTTAKQVSIQPISNQLTAGIGAAFRITPHGEQFSKPVSIVFTYKDEDLLNTLPEFLDIAYQDEKGTWQAMKNTTVDKVKKKITVTTTHFSDWGYFKSLVLDPPEAAVEQGGSVNLKATTLFPIVDPDDQPTVAVPKTPRELTAAEIKGWKYAGEGILVSRGAQGFYSAPDHEPAANPEVINLAIQMHRKGQFMLVSNITVSTKYHVDYLQVDEDELRPGQNGKCSLYMYGSFGTDPGVNNRAAKIGGTNVEISIWSPTIIVCKIDAVISGEIQLFDKEKLRVTSNLRKYTGVFT